MNIEISLINEIVSITSAIIGLIATVIIAVIQYKQGKRMEQLSLQQDKEEKRRREQYIKQQRDSFIMKYHNEEGEIYLLPLCWISSIYDSTLAYHRKMYMEYNMLEQDVQEAICERMNLYIEKPILSGEDFYIECVKTIQEAEKNVYIGNSHRSVFYDCAKYLNKCIELYGSKEVPHNLTKMTITLNNLLSQFEEDNTQISDPIEELCHQFGFYSSDELVASAICAIIAKTIAVHCGEKNGKDIFWIPGQYWRESLSLMEDLFLNALFCIYIYLMRNHSEE